MHPSLTLLSSLHPPHKIAIIGASIAGPVLALQILTHPTLRKQYTPILYDSSLPPSSLIHKFPKSNASQSPHQDISSPGPNGGAGIAITPNGLFPLFNLGLRQKIEENSCEFSGASFWSSSLGDEEFWWRDLAGGVEVGKWTHLKSLKGVSFARDIQSSIRVIERGVLQSIILERVLDLGGDVRFGCKFECISSLSDGRMRIRFEGLEKEEDVDLLVGADGVWSSVRKHILLHRHKDPQKTLQRWKPEFQNACGYYGISDLSSTPYPSDAAEEGTWNDTHGIWLNPGNLTTSPLPNGKMRWDLILPESSEPLPIPPPVQEPKKEYTEEEIAQGELEDFEFEMALENAESDEEFDALMEKYYDEMHADAKPYTEYLKREPWEGKVIESSVYKEDETLEILKRHAGVFHPVTGTFGKLLECSERIIRTPLRQRVWEENEIQVGNVVLIGDAGRLMLPSSGQGIHSFLFSSLVFFFLPYTPRPLSHL